MEITGYDNVIFTCMNPRGPVREALECLKERWGGLKLTDGKLIPLSIDEFSEECGFILALRDERMGQFMEEHGYEVMEDGDGPVAFLSRKRGPVSFELGNVKEVIKEDRLNIDPYDAWLCSSILFEITVITPRSPSSDAFSAWIFERTRHACLKPQ